MRICVLKLDEAVASGIGTLQLLKNLDAELIAEQPHLGGEHGYEPRAKKLQHRMKELYGAECDKQAIHRALWQA